MVADLIANANHGVTIRLAKPAGFFQNCAHYENDNSPIKKFNEPLAFARVPSHSVRARLLCAFAASASDLPTRLLNEQQYRAR